MLTDWARSGHVAVGSLLLPQGALTALAPVGWASPGVVLLVVGVGITWVGVV